MLNARATCSRFKRTLPLIRAGGSVILIGSTAGYMGVAVVTAPTVATKAACGPIPAPGPAELSSPIHDPFGIRAFQNRRIEHGARARSTLPCWAGGDRLGRGASNEDQRHSSPRAMRVPLNRLGRPEEIAAAALFFVLR